MGASPVNRILVDSNVYFRVGRDFYPLFGQPFGANPQNQLFIHAGTNHEYYNNPRLRTKFAWMSDAEYSDDCVSQGHGSGPRSDLLPLRLPMSSDGHGARDAVCHR